MQVNVCPLGLGWHGFLKNDKQKHLCNSKVIDEEYHYIM